MMLRMPPDRAPAFASAIAAFVRRVRACGFSMPRVCRPIVGIASVLAVLGAAGAASAHEDEHAGHAAAPPPQTVHSAVGNPGDPAHAARTLRIGMTDAMRFTPGEIVVKRGETVRLVVENEGRLMHELVLGTPPELLAHARAMRAAEGAPEHAHGGPNMTHVAPGQRGEIVWRFTRRGEFSYACLLPGHFEAGMAGKVVVR
jgi:uncharacterized cupredoxin-like copper-binding protein